MTENGKPKFFYGYVVVAAAFLMYAIISVVGLILISGLRPVKLGKAIANMS